jgi:VanZ family protein
VIRLATPTLQLNKPNRSWLYYWLPAVVWLVLVGVFSSRAFGATSTGAILAWALRLLHITLTGKEFMLVHGLLRKSAHFCAYGLLSALFFRAWRGASRGWRWTWAVLALVVAVATSSSDELHQHFTPGRTGAVSDVELDMTGAMFAQFMIVAFTATARRKQ